jgi:hypothetical protein
VRRQCIGSTSCDSCLSGHYSPEGQRDCTLCAAGTVAIHGGASVCDTCGSFSSSSDDRTYCKCYVGYYDNNREGSDASVSSCSTCPKGPDCGTAGTTFESMQTLPGYWRVDNQSLDYYVCPVTLPLM